MDVDAPGRSAPSRQCVIVQTKNTAAAGCSCRRVPARVILGIMSFSGFFTNYMLRVNVNLAIVDMAGFQTTSSQRAASSCAQGNSSLVAATKDPEFLWTAAEQALILGSFYWTYTAALVPGGLLARYFGTKLVFGTANLVSAVASLLSPVAARHHYAGMVVARLAQGLVSGATWPAMHEMAASWIPPHERSKFVSTYYGNAVGTAVTYPLCGLLIAHLGWEAAFYVPGALGLLWCALWWALVYDTPAKHPRISPKELELIGTALGQHVSAKRPAVPWRHMMTSLPFWALSFGNAGATWIFITVLTYGPTYMRNVHGLAIGMNGLMSGLPNVSRFLMGMLFSLFTDWMLRSGRWSITVTRKLATVAAGIVPAVLLLLLTNMGCDAWAEISVMTALMAFSGCASSGTLANSVDLAPNFAGVLLGLISLLSMSSGFVVPVIVSSLTAEEPSSFTQWRIIFSITASISVGCSLFFICFGSGEVQWWNSPQDGRQKTSKFEEDADEAHIPLK